MYKSRSWDDWLTVLSHRSQMFMEHTTLLLLAATLYQVDHSILLPLLWVHCGLFGLVWWLMPGPHLRH